MRSRAEFEKMNALVAEAVALCEAAQERFEQINAGLRKAIEEGRRLTGQISADEDKARNSLCEARLELSKRLRMRRRLLMSSTDS